MTIELQNLVKVFGKNIAVDHIDLVVDDGGFTVLLGPSGCGKTTTLRMIAGLEKPESGNILLNGKNVTHLQPKERGVAMVFQDYGLYPHMSVFDNVAFPLKIAKVDNDEIRRRVTDVIERLKIQELATRKPSQISGGEKQRVSLARALVRSPNVLLMDEPLSNLDALLRLRMRTEIKRIHQEMQKTTLYVTHDQVEALSLGTKIVVMNKGKIEQCATPNDIYYDPATKFVAQFVGSPPMNFMLSTIQSVDTEVILSTPSGFITISSKLTELLKKHSMSEKVVVGVRPEHFEINANTVNNEIGLKGVVKIIEALGKDTYLLVDVGSDELTIRTDPEEIFNIGDKIQLIPTQKYLYLFEPITGKRIQ